ncbi:MAG TPA: hypothetical protein VKT51_02980 [Candidatus Eremiobacteraceae bacterium]|nr:hypothetical protein [Candidatus Eremiobacteraceae bacterium]
MDITFTPIALTPAERRSTLVRRAWLPSERRVVARGLAGRALTALEPAAIGALLAWAAVALANRVTPNVSPPAHDALPIAIIFAPVAVAFFVYAAWLVRDPIIALRKTYEPIFIVDGYVRTRGCDDLSARGSCGYVAVLTADGRIAGEWPAIGPAEFTMTMRPAIAEFSEFGGIHAIDGRSTGILPRSFPALGVGANRPPA